MSREIGGFVDTQSQSRTVLERVMVINKLNRIFLEGLGVKGNRDLEKKLSKLLKSFSEQYSFFKN